MGGSKGFIINGSIQYGSSFSVYENKNGRVKDNKYYTSQNGIYTMMTMCSLKREGAL